MRQLSKRRFSWLGAGLLTLAAAYAQSGREPFTVVMLPDTQFYSKSYPRHFMDQVEWIRANARKESIVFVTHVGDVVDSGDRAPAEWEVADKAMSVLDGIVPWGAAPGNHDYDTGEPRGQAGFFRKHFGPERFTGKAWYGGSSPNGLNSYQFFTGGGTRFLILHLECDVPDDAIAWAAKVMKRNRGVPTIVSTHVYLDGKEGRGKAPFYRRDGANSGERIWEKLIRKQPQVFLVLCGHWSGERRQVSVNDAGGNAIEIMADYQSRPGGGNGWLRVMRFDPARGEIGFRTYSPTLGAYETDEDSEFTVRWPHRSVSPRQLKLYNMTPGADSAGGPPAGTASVSALMAR